NSTASFSFSTPDLSFVLLSTFSQAGDVRFINTSLSTAYIAYVLVPWNFDVTVKNDTAPMDDFSVRAGYGFDLARRTEFTGGTDYFFKSGFITAISGEEQRLSGSDSF